MLVYGSNKPSSMSSIEAWNKPTASLAVRGEKLGGDPHVGQPVCWECSQEFLFLESIEIHTNLSATRERLLDVDRMRYVWSRAICELSIENMWRVGWVFPCRVYIDSNCRDSRI
jgi:hypothetical protein